MVQVGRLTALLVATIAAAAGSACSRSAEKPKQPRASQLDDSKETRFAKAMELMEMKLLAHMMTERNRERIVSGSQVTDDEVRAHWEQHKHEMTEDPRFSARHLLVHVAGNPAFPEKGLPDAKAEARAKKALALLRAGKTWDAVARDYSDDELTKQHGGLMHDRQFGFFPAEFENAVKTQAPGKPGPVFRTVFGYNVLQVEECVPEKRPRRYEDVKQMVAERLTEQKLARSRAAFMDPIRKEVGFRITAAGRKDSSLLDEGAVAPDEVLAEVAGKKIRESDLRWFLQDALMPSQRKSAYGRPGARQSMLGAYLDMLVLEARARREGLDHTEEYARERDDMEKKLIEEFRNPPGSASVSPQ